MPSHTLAFPEDLKDFIDFAVKSGRFAGPNEVVASALYALRDQVELEHAKLGRLRSDVAIGIKQIDSGEVVADWSLDAFLKEMKAKGQSMVTTA